MWLIQANLPKLRPFIVTLNSDSTFFSISSIDGVAQKIPCLIPTPILSLLFPSSLLLPARNTPSTERRVLCFPPFYVYVLTHSHSPCFSSLRIQRVTYKLRLQPSIISSLALFGVLHSSYFYLLTTTIYSYLSNLLPSWADHRRILACYIRSCVVYPVTLSVCFIVAPWLRLWLVYWIPRQPRLSKQQQSPLVPDLCLFFCAIHELDPKRPITLLSYYQDCRIDTAIINQLLAPFATTTGPLSFQEHARTQQTTRNPSVSCSKKAEAILSYQSLHSVPSSPDKLRD